MKRLVSLGGLLLLGAWSAGAQPNAPSLPPPRPLNILFISVDDLNHWVGPLGRHVQVKTPRMDRFAARGVTFTRAYCAAPLCNPSRAAVFSGMRPSTTGIYDNSVDWRTVVPPEKTLPAHLRAHGYWTGAAGKIHQGGYERASDFDAFLPAASDTKPAAPVHTTTAGPLEWGVIEGGDEHGHDKPSVDWVIRQLRRRHEKPFFLACGIFRPNMPWQVPKKYFDLYPLESILPPPARPNDLEDVPAAGIELANPKQHEEVEQSGRWKEAVQAYLAAISYADHEVGRLLDALELSPYFAETAVVLWSDHGWHLGEKRHWRKFTLWEEATHVPMIWMVPGVTQPGTRCERTVDLTCLYPTLCEIAGVPIPPHVEGLSIRKLLARPDAHWIQPAITTCGFNNHAVRSEQWRFIRYHDGSEELYDEVNDPFEWTNLAARPDRLSYKWELAHWMPRTNVPPTKTEAQDEPAAVAVPETTSTLRDQHVTP